MIYKQTGNLRVVQILLGHTKIESTVRYLGVDVDMLARKPRMLIVALANKMARIVWAVLMKQEDYRAPVAAAA